jgi:hypothetical protein
MTTVQAQSGGPEVDQIPSKMMCVSPLPVWHRRSVRWERPHQSGRGRPGRQAPPEGEQEQLPCHQ